MKALIILAALLLVPIVMKFQQQEVRKSARTEAPQRVGEILLRNGVIEPTVAVNFLDVSIGGVVANEEKAKKVSQEVDALRGLRLTDNRLKVQGWLQVGRDSQGQVYARGAVAPGWVKDGLNWQSKVDTSKLSEEKSILMAGPHPAAWGVFADEFLAEKGQREFLFRSSKLTLSGEATPSLASRLAKSAGDLTPRLELEEDFDLQPSTWHYPSRITESSASGEALRSLSRTLADTALEFSEGSAQVSSQSAESLTKLAKLLVESQPGNRFILGSYPDEIGAELGRQRAQAVKVALQQNGVPPEVLEVAVFEMTEDRGKLRGQVELLVR